MWCEPRCAGAVRAYRRTSDGGSAAVRLASPTKGRGLLASERVSSLPEDRPLRDLHPELQFQRIA
jgi:hypothetical protein